MHIVMIKKCLILKCFSGRNFLLMETPAGANHNSKPLHFRKVKTTTSFRAFKLTFSTVCFPSTWHDDFFLGGGTHSRWLFEKERRGVNDFETHFTKILSQTLFSFSMWTSRRLMDGSYRHDNVVSQMLKKLWKKDSWSRTWVESYKSIE